MAGRVIGTNLLLVLLCGAASPGWASEKPTAFEKYITAASRAEQAGNRVEAEKLLRAALAEAKKLGPNDPHVAIALNNLAGLYFSGEEKVKAITFMKQALAAAEASFGPVHAQVAGYLSNLATFYGSNNQDAEAEKCLKRAREIQEQLPDVPSWNRVMILSNLSGLYERQHRYTESEAALDNAIEILKSSPEVWNQEELVRVERTLAQVYRQEGKEAEAERLLNDIYEGAQSGYEGAQAGAKVSPDSASLRLLEQANDERGEGRLDAAEAGYRQVIADMEKRRGRNPTVTTQALEGLAEVCVAEGRDEEAEELFKRAIALREEDASRGNPFTARNLAYPFGLLNFYRDRRRLADMEPVYERALSIQEKVLGAEDGVVAETALQFARLYLEEAKDEQALPLYEQALRVQKRNWGETARFADALDEYAGLLSRLNKEDEAAAVRSQAEAIRKRIAPQNKNP